MRLLVTLFCILSPSFWGRSSLSGDFSVPIKTGGSFEVFTHKDSNGLPDSYRATLKVPVCEDRLCYDVKIGFTWNLIGEFEAFEVPSDEPLTKLDHVPFTQEDYLKLSAILSNREAYFVQIPFEELVDPSSEVDAHSGATKASIKNEVIEGALYTCYTLWHIVHGPVVDSIRAYTAQRLDGALVNKLVAQKKPSLNYYLLATLRGQALEQHLEAVLTMIRESKGYFSKNAIEAFPPKLFEQENVREFTKNYFGQADYYTQKAILTKLAMLDDCTALSAFLLTQLTSQNTFLAQSLVEILLKKPDKPTLAALIRQLETQRLTLSVQNHTRLTDYALQYGLPTDQLPKP